MESCELERKPEAFRVCKRSIPVTVDFAKTGGEFHTREGLVRYVAGDALLTGVEGETWPVSRDNFFATYETLDSTINGEPGLYVKTPRTVWAWRPTREVDVALPEGRGLLHAYPGDVIIEYAPGNHGVVDSQIFDKTYVVLDPPLT